MALQELGCGVLELRGVYGSATIRDRLLDRRFRFRLNMAANDLSRDAYGTPVVAEPGADASYLDAQMQLLLMRFHNRVMDHFANANAMQGITTVSDAVLFDRTSPAMIDDTVLALSGAGAAP